MLTDGLHYFNRCRRCHSLLTKLQIKDGLARDGQVCSCGSGMFSPSNLLWYEWAKPAVLRMVVYQLLGRLAPPPQSDVMPAAPKSMLAVPPLSPAEIRMPEEGE